MLSVRHPKQLGLLTLSSRFAVCLLLAFGIHFPVWSNSQTDFDQQYHGQDQQGLNEASDQDEPEAQDDPGEEGEQEEEGSTLEGAAKISPSRLPLNQLRNFTEIFERIRSYYVKEISDTELLDKAIQGMLDGLDPHSAYLRPEDYTDLQSNTSGRFGGLGLEVGYEDDFIKVIAPIDDTPAQRAGIESGDLILKIDGQSLKGMTLNEAIENMRGEPGSKIVLTIAKEPGGDTRDIELVRDEIRVTSVRHRVINDSYGYIRIAQFQEATGPDLEEALENLMKDNKALAGIVIDLRNNPGGILESAVAVVDTFISTGLIVYTKGRTPAAEMSYSATPTTFMPEMPLVVLINGGSASASEIVAGALQDHRRAVIMGTDSFGKGSVQTVMPLDNEHGLKLTTALYYTPKGRSIQAQGIVPDIIVEQGRFQRSGEEDFYKEADLEGHLSNGNGRDDRTSDKIAKDRSRNTLSEEDFQLYEAVTLLKGLKILQKIPEA